MNSPTKASFALFTASFVLTVCAFGQNTFPASGNVGVGVASPSYQLEVRGSSKFYPAAGGDNAVLLSTGGQSLNQSGLAIGYGISYNGTSMTVSGFLQAEAQGSGYRNLLLDPLGGNVGIGTTTPNYALSFGNTLGKTFALFESNGTNLYGFAAAGSGTSADPYRVKTFANGTEWMSVTASGNVGVGTVSPAASLDVGGLAAAGALRTVFARQAEGNTTGSGTFLGVKAWGTQATPYNNKMFSIESTFYGYLNSSIEFYRGGSTQGGFTTFTTGDGTERLRIDPVGNVGIGTTNPTQKLSVNGTVRAKEVIVDTGWSDYVFKPDYKLASLSEVEGAIKRDGHLPGIPSAAEVAEHGVSMGDMQSKLLAKIEELTLHVIAQEKRINKLEIENASLRTRK